MNGFRNMALALCALLASGCVGLSFDGAPAMTAEEAWANGCISGWRPLFEVTEFNLGLRCLGLEPSPVEVVAPAAGAPWAPGGE